jgi:peptidyl-prolyl cis-trans isomerase B (cyclophilin B)
VARIPRAGASAIAWSSALVAIAVPGFAAGDGADSARDSTAVAPVPSPAPAQPPAPAPVPPVDVRVVVAEFGEFVIRLDAERVPNAASLFLTLASSGAFDGLTFHRVIPGLLIQTGDPWTRDDDASNDESTAPPWSLPAEATTRTHTRGTVSFAWRNTDSSSGGMQWFVTLEDTPALDGRATPIGQVVDGMDVVDRIAQVSTFRDRRPVHAVRIQAVKLEPAASHPAPAAAPATPPAPPANGNASGSK